MAQYSDNVANDVNAILESQEEMIDPIQCSWSMESLGTLSDLISYCVTSVDSMKSLVVMSSRLGRIGRKLDFSGSSNTISTIKHMIGLVKTSIHLKSNGATVHLIEGCMSNGVQVIGDLDLLYTDVDGSTYAVDYTNVNSPRTGVFVVNEKMNSLVESKYRKLESMYPQWEARVMCCGDVPYFEINFPNDVFHGSPREQDFKGADDIIHWIRQVNVEQAKCCLEQYASRVQREEVDTRGLIIEPSNAPVENVYRMVSNNNPEVARMYYDAMKQMSIQCIDKYMSTFLFDQIDESAVTTSFKMPLFKTGCYERDPFVRCKFICDQMEDESKQVHPILRGLSMLGKESKVTMLVDGHRITMTRIHNKEGEPFNAVRMKFQDMTWLDFREVIKHHTVQPDVDGSFVQLEEKFVEYDQDWMESTEPSFETKLIETYINSVMHNGSLSEEVRTFMKSQLATIKNTKLLSWISQVQEICHALLSVPSKNKSLKGVKKGKADSNEIVLSIDNISDRYAVALTGMGAATYGSDANWSYIVLGNDTCPKMCIPTWCGCSRLLSCSLAHLDWNSLILERTISYYSLLTEMRGAVQGSKVDIKSERSFPMMLMVQNNNKFAQASEMTRHIFVNGTGLSGSPKSLYEKISWFVPNTFTQKLYMLRLLKMGDVLQMAKANSMIDGLRSTYKSKVSVTNSGLMDRYCSCWDIALPHEVSPCTNDAAVFNGFYICRAMTIQRYNKLVSESLVLEKQLDSREEYLEVKSHNYEHELRNCREHSCLDDFLDDLNYYDEASQGPWSASWRTQCLSIMATAIKMGVTDEDTLGDIFDKKLNLVSVMRTLTIPDVMNSRGSVKSNSNTGLVKTEKVKLNGHTVTVNQNDKCWHTILEGLDCVIKGVEPPKADYNILASQANEEIKLSLDLLVKSNDSLWPMIVWASECHAMCVSKMVHKDQIGSREIAVLNCWSRVMCYYVECLARTVRDQEHKLGIRTNLIERRDKESEISSIIGKAMSERTSGSQIIFDSADCSKWGPSMMVGNLYLTLGCRMNSKCHRNILRNCLSLFGTKIFKIPDHFYLKKTTVNLSANSKVDNVLQRLKRMTPDMGDYDNQYIKLEESMHQGILGCTSSVYGGDAHNLSDWVLEHIFIDQSLSVTTRLTSDDYSRILTWKGSMGYYKMAKSSLAVHNAILLACGIKRNLQKSAMSVHQLEFNSVFHTYSGDFRPDVKQRLALVDYGQSLDTEPNAESSMVKGVEYLRQDGGLIGSCWIGVLNNVLAMRQNQTLELFHSIGDSIHSVPLELGGLIRVDPLVWQNGTKLMSVVENYSEGSSVEAFSQLMSHMPSDVKSIEPFFDDEEHLKISSASRSGIIHKTTRAKRSTRNIKEFLASIPRNLFLDLIKFGRHNSLLHSLMACSHREVQSESTEGSAMRLANCWHVKDVDVFLCNCAAYSKLGERLSRRDLMSLAVKFASGERPVVEQRDPPFSSVELERTLSRIVTNEQNLTIDYMSWMPRKLHKEPVNLRLSSTFYLSEKMSEFDEKFSPLTHSNIDPLEYLESKELYRQRLTKLIRAKSSIYMALMEGDQVNTALEHRILLSNFFGGCRCSLKGVSYTTEGLNWNQDLSTSAIALQNGTHTTNGITSRFGSYRYAAAMRAKKVGMTDLTGVMNMLSGDSDYTFTNSDLRNNILSILFKASTVEPDCFIIHCRTLTKNFKSVEYACDRLLHVIQRPLINSHMITCGREFIFKSGRKWLHKMVLLSDEIAIPENTAEDEYDLLDLCEMVDLHVYLKEYLGYLMLCTRSGFPLQILSQTLFKTTEIALWSKKSMTEQLDDLMKLGVYDVTKTDRCIEREVFLESIGYFPNISTEKPLTKDDDDIEDALLGKPSEVGFIPSFLTASVNTTPSFLTNAAPAAPLFPDIDWGSDDDDDDEGYDSEEDEDNDEDVDENDKLVASAEALRPMTESGLSYPQWILSQPMSLAQVSDVTKEARESMDMDYGDKMYYITLPVALPDEAYKDDDTGSCFAKLLQAIDNIGGVESDWLRNYVLVGLSECGEVKHAFHMRKADLARAQRPSFKSRKFKFI